MMYIYIYIPTCALPISHLIPIVPLSALNSIWTFGTTLRADSALNGGEPRSPDVTIEFWKVIALRRCLKNANNPAKTRRAVISAGVSLAALERSNAEKWSTFDSDEIDRLSEVGGGYDARFVRIDAIRAWLAKRNAPGDAFRSRGKRERLVQRSDRYFLRSQRWLVGRFRRLKQDFTVAYLLIFSLTNGAVRKDMFYWSKHGQGLKCEQHNWTTTLHSTPHQTDDCVKPIFWQQTGCFY